MSIVCARPNCALDALPASQKKLASFVTLLCTSGEGRHQQSSNYAHINCAEELSLSLVGRVGYLPYGYELVVSYDPSERKVSEHRTNTYYYCGQPGCLVSLLKRYGNNVVRRLLDQAETDPDEAFRLLPPLDDQAWRQLKTVIEEVGRQTRLQRVEEGAPMRLEPGATGERALRPSEEAEDLYSPGSKNILLVGAGAVGSFLASKLLLGGHEVVVVDRPKQTAAIRPVGFRLHEGGQVRAAQPAAVVTSLSEAFPSGLEYDLLILTTKAYDAAHILEQLPSAKFSLPRKVMTIQNGIGVEEKAGQLLGSNRILAASLTTPLSVSSPGSVTVEHGGRGLGLALMGKREPVDEWVNMFRAAGINTKAYPNYQAMKWSKLLVNMVANATCAILNRKPAVIYRYRPTFMLERAMLRETLAVMKEMGVPVVDLPGSRVRLLAWVINYLPVSLAQMLLAPQIERGRGEKMPSLYLDLAAGRKQSEVIFLNGAVVRCARELGISAPVNFALTDTLHKLFQGLLLWDDFRGKPEALLARIRGAK